MHAHDTPTAFDAALDAIVERMRPSGGGLAQAFTPFPIVVGARWMETPIRQGLAQRHGVAANLVFLLVDDAVDRLVAPRDGADAGWWEETDAGAAWCVAALRGKVVRALRAPGHAEVGALAASLEVTATGALGWRSLAFADQLATALLAWMRARPEAPVAAGASSAAWFAPLAATLALDQAGSPRQLRAAALTGAAPKAAGPWGGPLVVGTTTLPAATRRLLERFGATFLPVLPDAPAEGLASRLRVRPCYGPLREVEALRDWLLELLAAGEGAHGVARLTPRDVVVFTASPEVYGPLVESVFGRRAGAVERPSVKGRGVKGEGVKGEGASVAPTEEGDDVLPDTEDTEDTEDTVEAESAREDAAEEAEEDEERAAEHDDPAARADGDGRGASVKAAAPPPRRAPPVIPVRVVELGLSRSNPLAEALLRVLGLAEDRVELPAFLSLMALRPVQRRFGLSPEDVSALTDMLVASGARWGLDAEDRGVADQPKLEQNTLRFGLERMALGRLLPAETLDVGADREPRVTMDLGSREQLARVGRLDRLLRALEEAMRDLRATQPGGLLPSGWRVRFGALLAAFTDISAAGAWQRQRLDEVLHELLPAEDDAIGLLSASAVRRLLADGFALPQGASPPNEGAVTFAPLRPHGVPPARVVALLGMGLGAFPRTPVLPAWHPLADALPAEPGPREIAAAAFDAACAAATDRLWISWPGFEMQRGRELPPCAPVSRLLDEARLTDALEEAMKRAPAPLGRVERDAPVARVHRHPWEAATDTILDPDHADVHGVAAEAAASKAKVESAGRVVAPPSPDPYRQPLPDPDRPTALTVDDLVRALLNPSEVFLRERLGIYLPDDDDPPAAREPLEVDTLDRYDVRTRLLKARGGGAADASAPDGAAADAAAAEVLLRLRGEGKLPVAAGADSYVGKQDRMVEALLDAWTAESPVGERLAVGLSATIDGVTLSTQVDRITRTEEGWTVELLGVSSPKGRRARLRTWVTTLLAARLGGEQPVRGTYWGLDTDGPDTFEVAPLTETETAAALPGLLDVWRQARTRPLELFEGTSADLAKAEAETEEGSIARTAELRAAAHGFHGEPGEFTFPDGMNRHVRALRPTYDAVGAVSEKAPELLDLSRKVWGGLAEQERARKERTKEEAAAKAAKAAVKKGGAK